MGNRPEWVAWAFGVARAGGVLIPLNTMFEPPEIAWVLGHSDAAVVVHQSRLGHHDFDAQLTELERKGDLAYLTHRLCIGSPAYDAFLQRGDQIDPALVEARAEAVSPFDDALVTYTSGTTGKPKGVLHAHRPPSLQSWRFAQQFGIAPTARVWSAFPFFWTAGFCMVMGATLAAGGCIVLQEMFEPGEAIALLQEERVSMPHAWPHQLAALESHPDWAGADLSSVRYTDAFSCFGRHPTSNVAEDWSVRAAYGLTETFTIVSSVPADTPSSERLGHQGDILPGNSVRIVDPVTGHAQEAGVAGEIRVKGPTLMRGYLKVAPEDVFDEDGFFATGDAGYVSDKGHLHWVGRTSGLIKTGGANVSPVEIENELLESPDLACALAVGVPHETLGEIVVVCAVAKHGHEVSEDDVRDFLRGKLAAYKLPRRVLFFDEGELTLTGNAKVKSDDLRRLAIARLEPDSQGGATHAR